MFRVQQSLYMLYMYTFICKVQTKNCSTITINDISRKTTVTFFLLSALLTVLPFSLQYRAVTPHCLTRLSSSSLSPSLRRVFKKNRCYRKKRGELSHGCSRGPPPSGSGARKWDGMNSKDVLLKCAHRHSKISSLH